MGKINVVITGVGGYDTVSKLKVEMGATMEELKTLYHDYKQNIID